MIIVHRTTFRHPRAFWLGTAAVVVGVALHLPMLLGARRMHYRLAGMAWSGWMVLGMALIVGGLVACLYGVSPRQRRSGRCETTPVEVRGLDDAKLHPAHVRLMAALAVAIAIDTIKPFTFAFILPGVASEYGLSSPAHPAPGHLPVALLPLAGIVGTVLGSLLWGYLADRIGRRGSILLAASIFIATSACGAMPAFGWNMVMCLAMGIGAGGLLPVAYSLLTETIPARRRGQVVVLVAGVGTALGFLLTSWAAHWLIPVLSWRAMWFVGLPSGLLLVGLQRSIPESPRFLLARGRGREAREVMRALGVDVIKASPPLPSRCPAADPDRSSLFARPLAGISTALALYGVAWGLVNFGFLVWLPVDLARGGVSAAHVTSVLARAALLSLPGSLVVSWLYGRWSSKATMILLSALSAGSLAVFALTGAGIVRHGALFTALLVVLLISLWGSISVLAPYSAEVYPTRLRAAGAGVAAGASKLGGVLALTMSTVVVAPPGLAGSALIAAGVTALGAVGIAVWGIETRGRRLEEIAPVRPSPTLGERQ